MKKKTKNRLKAFGIYASIAVIIILIMPILLPRDKVGLINAFNKECPGTLITTVQLNQWTTNVELKCISKP